MMAAPKLKPLLKRMRRRPRLRGRIATTITGQGDAEIRIISWNLLHSVGASIRDVLTLLEREKPDLLLMQEATQEIDQLPDLVGGYYARSPLPGRIHGVACWSRTPFSRAPRTCVIPSGMIVRRIAQIIRLPSLTVANVHLSHGQIMNRRQLRRLSAILPAPAAILGDFNLVGPTLVPGFSDVGPRAPTHRMVDLVPIRIDRCLIRGAVCENAEVLPVFASDHRPIMVTLRPGVAVSAAHEETTTPAE
ncbi:endonuclease/exonuclease/phosphatase family protein [Acetobacter sp.]|jgi:endonuclease/exonuclease/phosphatase (EEP) superfamily protein YafD|uniref:endonuclease/exonuclease/phosphatase family protein n=1 Tax=Acetobacter sp. TaxID=440 RepID=UPI0025BBB597|nr:endonuclease/exonuclease/phosphatase family protein [Acetobacter sp.]MCH4092618.1 endonuclease/exonuclease/phosphatase family protein [Acetobacter sp.]MCI1299752.1 endonuclease/exonuclease/phosphatase family protein [Acetobacter sp.]MCI1315368.1 endonuclease/exonuclease/phosphatase family protein [Acetobacter sp.]